MLSKKNLENREAKLLARYAVRSNQSQGRKYAEPPPAYRTEFQRDRDRVIHCKAFRRLKHKTQVFVTTQQGDHYRTRLTHTLEVTQISRDLARTLGLNEDLAETIALAHDLGHTPFGHTGEKVLNELLQAHGGFEHNRQSRKIVEHLEKKYPDFDGLNLSYEVLDGLIKHRSPYDNGGAVADCAPTLEAQIVNLADEAAYNSHDVDDAIASGLLTPQDLQKVRLWSELTARQKKLRPGLSTPALVNLNIRALIGGMINDILQETENRLRRHKIKNLRDVHNAPTELVGFSRGFGSQIAELRDFLYRKFYRHPQVVKRNKAAEKIIAQLFKHLVKHPAKALASSTFLHSEPIEIAVGDFIAGMTDQYALSMAKGG
ncbi:deoxyguanosinetriphosphate triphosphohydrolase [Candidatus Termititenax persephonae]|uniref:Deoxyguanosinetriphosphate triphosphohydrolase-like protein n=1 Tax=Candidatus Termititenax persephonae TaxID=2218525 RepID=A0A388TFC9_9BACT|nr:deoxyguanosinetriphosphate triphosphohydrolase [Candidatus Termititenax persephonae]